LQSLKIGLCLGHPFVHHTGTDILTFNIMVKCVFNVLLPRKLQSLKTQKNKFKRSIRKPSLLFGELEEEDLMNIEQHIETILTSQ